MRSTNRKKAELAFFRRGGARERAEFCRSWAKRSIADFATTRGRNGFDGDLEAWEAGSGGEPLITLHYKLANNNKLAVAA